MDGLHVALIGRLGADSELKYTQGGLVLLRCSVCVKDPQAEKGGLARWVEAPGESDEQLAARVPGGSSRRDGPSAPSIAHRAPAAVARRGGVSRAAAGG